MFNKGKLWHILMILVLIVGCEKKEHPIEIQTDSSTVPIAEKSPRIESSQSTPKIFTEYESIEHEENSQNVLILEEPKEGTQIKLILKRPLLSRREERIEYVDQNASMLKFFKCTISGIEGLGQLESLDTIIFDRVSGLDNLFFLADVPHLKRLFIEYIAENIDWRFVEQLPNLQVLYVESYFQPTISIDLINNRNLEYIGFSSGVLESFPAIYNVPISLKYLNLEGNKIAYLPFANNMPSQTTILLGINPFVKDEKTPANVMVEFADRIIQEEKYRIPLSIPFISDVGH